MSVTDRLKETSSKVTEFSEGYLAFVLALAAAVKGDLYEFGKLDEFAHAKGGQVDTVITVVVVAVVAVVGILIYSEVDQAISVSGSLSSSKGNLTSGFGDAMELVPIVLIVLVAALVIGVISRFRN